MRRTTLSLVLLATACAGTATPPAPSPDAALAAARTLLEHGAAAWNGGDLDGFMADYTDDATFVTPRAVVRGRAAIRALYARRFAPGAVRDSLHFEALEADPLAHDALNAVAYYVLSRGDSVTARGPTSLVLRRVNGRWLIAHDHSS